MKTLKTKTALVYQKLKKTISKSQEISPSQTPGSVINKLPVCNLLENTCNQFFLNPSFNHPLLKGLSSPQNDSVRLNSLLNQDVLEPEKDNLAKILIVANEAISRHKLDLHWCELFKKHLLPYLRKGHVNIQIETLAKPSYAAYDHQNNTLFLSPKNFEINDWFVRGIIIHECIHIMQDILQWHTDRYTNEWSAHDGFAYYVLRDQGALKKTPQGIRTDFSIFNRLVNESRMTGPDLKRMIARFLEQVKANQRSGRMQLNSPPLNTLTFQQFETVIAAADRYPEYTFDKCYLLSFISAHGGDLNRVHQRFSHSYAKNGLSEVRFQKKSLH